MSHRHYLRWILAMAVSLSYVVPALSADKYVVDTAHTTVGFVVRHLVLTKVRGKFNEFTGTILYDADDLTKSSVNGTIKVASIDTGNEKRDNDLRSENFFDVAKYPEITFTTTGIEQKGDGYILHGDLSMHGVTKAITIPFEMTGQITFKGTPRLGFEGSFTLNRRDYDITYSQTTDSGGLVVGDTIQIELVVEAVKAK